MARTASTPAYAPKLDHIVRILALAAFLYAGQTVQAADAYLCTAEMITGFNYDSVRKGWRSADFRSEKKIEIRRAKQKSHAWEAREPGDALPGAMCQQDFNEAGNLFCSGVFELRFSRRQMRFLYVYPIGYWNDASDGPASREGENTPALAIGRCRES